MGDDDAVEVLQQEVPRWLGRAVLPVDKIGQTGGTVFLFNYLVARGLTRHNDKVLTFLVTTRDVASGPMATLGLVRHVVGGASDELAFPSWSDHWSRPADDHIDVALLPFFHLEDHARRKGWTWNTQEVTDGMLLKAGERLVVLDEEVGVYGYEGERDKSLADRMPVLRSVSFHHAPDGTTSVVGASTILAGAPIIGLAPRPDGNARFVVAGMIGSPSASDQGTRPRPFIPGAVIRSAAQEYIERS